MTEHEKSVALMRFLSEVATTLGVAEHVYVVGGAVRNHLLGLPVKDTDLVLDVKALGEDRDSAFFAKEVAKAFGVETSLETNQYGVALLTVKSSFVYEGVDLQGEVVEVANSRTESYGGAEGKGYKPHMVQAASVEEDLARREFTVNTLMYRLSDLRDGLEGAEVLDLTGQGVKDLQEMTLRCPSDPDQTFSDDPSRMLRACKFALKYGFKLSAEVVASVRRNAQKLKQAPYGALSALLVHNVLEPHQRAETLQMLEDLGLLEVVKEMMEEDHAFYQTLVNFGQRADVSFLFNCMDYEFKVYRSLQFLSGVQGLKLRSNVERMEAEEAKQYLKVLKQPGKVLDTPKLMTLLGLQGAEVRDIMELARNLMLETPSLAFEEGRLTEFMTSLKVA